MSQDQFDKWLKNRVEGHLSTDGLDQEWDILQDRLGEEENRRRPVFWYWLTGLGCLLLALVIGGSIWYAPVDDENKNTEKQDVEIEKTIESSNPTAALNKEENTSENVVIRDEHALNTHDESEVDRGLSTNHNRRVVAEATFGARPAVAISTKDGGERTESHSAVFPIANDDLSADGSSINTSKGNALHIPREPIELDKLPLNFSGLDEEIEIVDVSGNALRRSATSNSLWSLSFAGFIGDGFATYSGADNELAAFEAAETFKEHASLQLQIMRRLNGGWSIGAGLGIGYQHVTSKQDFLDTVRGNSPDQIIKIMEDADGQISAISGPGQGSIIYDVDRITHQSHMYVSLPVTLAYEWTISTKWRCGLSGSFIPQVNFRRGQGIRDTDKDLILEDISNRYENSLTSALGAGVHLGYQWTDKIESFFGVAGQYQVQGSTIENKDIHQRTGTIGSLLGLRYTL